MEKKALLYIYIYYLDELREWKMFKSSMASCKGLKFMFHNGFVYCMHFDDIFGLIEHNVPMIEAAMNIRGACTWQAARKCDLKFCFRGCWSMKCSAKPMNFGS